MKWWAKLGIGLGLGFVAFKLLTKVKSLQQVSASMETDVHARVHSIDFKRVLISLDIVLKNPGAEQLSIKYPFIKVGHKLRTADGKEQIKTIASSEMKNEDVMLLPYQQTEIKDLRIPVSYINMGSLAPIFLKKLKDKNVKIELLATIISTVKTDLGTFPFTETKDISL